MTHRDRSATGFTGPIVIHVAAPSFDLFSIDAIRPQPTNETLDADTRTLTFDPPTGRTFRAQWDLAAQPIGRFATAHGEARIDIGNDPTAPLRFDSP